MAPESAPPANRWYAPVANTRVSSPLAWRMVISCSGMLRTERRELAAPQLPFHTMWPLRLRGSRSASQSRPSSSASV